MRILIKKRVKGVFFDEKTRNTPLTCDFDWKMICLIYKSVRR